MCVWGGGGGGKYICERLGGGQCEVGQNIMLGV